MPELVMTFPTDADTTYAAQILAALTAVIGNQADGNVELYSTRVHISGATATVGGVGQWPTDLPGHGTWNGQPFGMPVVDWRWTGDVPNDVEPDGPAPAAEPVRPDAPQAVRDDWDDGLNELLAGQAETANWLLDQLGPADAPPAGAVRNTAGNADDKAATADAGYDADGADADADMDDDAIALAALADADMAANGDDNPYNDMAAVGAVLDFLLEDALANAGPLDELIADANPADGAPHDLTAEIEADNARLLLHMAALHHRNPNVDNDDRVAAALADVDRYHDLDNRQDLADDDAIALAALADAGIAINPEQGGHGNLVAVTVTYHTDVRALTVDDVHIILDTYNPTGVQVPAEYGGMCLSPFGALQNIELGEDGSAVAVFNVDLTDWTAQAAAGCARSYGAPPTYIAGLDLYVSAAGNVRYA